MHLSTWNWKRKILYKLYEQYTDNFSLHQGNISHMKLLTVDIDTAEYLPIVQKHIPVTVINIQELGHREEWLNLCYKQD